MPTGDTSRKVTDEQVISALYHHNGNVSRAAKMVGVTRPTLIERRKRLIARGVALPGVPWLLALGVETVAVLEIPDGMWTLLTVGIGGYVVGRTIENTGSSVRIGVNQNQVGGNGSAGQG